MAEQEPLGTCYGAGSIAGAIIGTLLITLALVGAAALLYSIYWRSRKGKHLVLVTDVENPADHYAFDNPNFREATPIKQSPVDQDKTGKLDLSWLGGWSPLHVFSTPRNDKQRSLDDSFITDSQLKVVSLKSHDFTGLGFSVCGNMRDGIFVKDLLHRGPAFESGSINPGDRIDSVCISFRHMVFEDALTILSYASPYEVQVQVEHNATSRPSTLLRKRDTSAPSGAEPILHPFYRSQSIADLAMIGKSSGRRSNQQPINTSERSRATKTQDTNISASDYPTIKLAPTGSDTTRKEQQSLEKRAIDAVDGTEPPKHAKFGIRVLPVTLHARSKDHTDNEHNIAIEQELSTDRVKAEDEGKDVKAILTKGLQNLKEKINQNTLGRKKKEGELQENAPPEPAARTKTPVPVTEQPEACTDVPEEVARAGAMARNNRKSVSAESLAARRPAAELPVMTPHDSDTSSEGSHPRPKKTKGKAPAPPQVAKETDSGVMAHSIFEPPQADSDSEAEGMELTCTHATVHHNSAPEEPDSGRKAASLGDLSRLDDPTSSGPLERAVSLDLDASHGKKRKAPPPPPEDFPGAFEDGAGYRKEPRLEGYSTFQRRLKKSSDFGTLEDALQDSDNEDSASFNKKSNSPEPVTDLSSLAATNIQEFSTWLEEVRKPQSEIPADHHLTLNVNSETTSLEHEVGDELLTRGSAAWDISTSSEIGNNSDILYSSALSTEIGDDVTSLDASTPTLATQSQRQDPDIIRGSTPSSVTFDLNPETIKALDQDTAIDVVVSSHQAVSSPDTSPTEPVVNSTQTSDHTFSSSQITQPAFTFSVNGFNLQEPSRTVLLISQPNSLDPEVEEVPPAEDDTPPQLPTSPPPTASPTYVTEIRVSTPSTPTTPRTKPQRKDLSPDVSRIPIRTMKSETGQKVLAAIQSLAAKEMGKGSFEIDTKQTVPSVAGFYLKKVPPAVPPRRGDASHQWAEGMAKERVNGTPLHLQMQTGVSLPVKTSGTKIVFESPEHNEEF